MIAKHIASALRSMAPALASLTEALLLIAGALLIACGSWQAYRPAGPIVLGVLIIAGVILRARGGS